MNNIRNLNFALITFTFLSLPNLTYSATINNNESKSTSSLTDNDILIFIGAINALNQGVLDVDASITLGNISANNGTNSSGIGNINFTSSNKTLTVDGNIGSSNSLIKGINIGNSGNILNSKGDIYSESGITVSNSGQATLNLSGTSAQKINGGNIGRENGRVNIINSNAAGITFETNAFTSNITNNGVIKISDGKDLNIFANITSTGTIQSVSSGTSTSSLTFSGNSLQSVATQIGSSNAIGTININNSAGVTFSEGFATNDLVLTNGSITIATNKEGLINGNITGNDLVLEGSINIKGDADRNVNVKIQKGSSSSNIQVGEYNKNNIFTFNKALDVTSFAAHGKVVLAGSETMNVGTLFVDGEIRLSNNVNATSFSSSFGQTTIDAGKILTISDNGNSDPQSIVGRINIGINNSANAKIKVEDGAKIITIPGGAKTIFHFNYSGSNINPNNVYTFLESTDLKGSSAPSNVGEVNLESLNTLATDNSILIKSQIEKNGNNLQVRTSLDNSTVNQLSPKDQHNIDVITNSNIATNSGGNMATVQNQLYQISNMSTLQTALKTLSTPTDNSANINSLGIIDQFNRIINMRVSALSSTDGFGFQSNSFSGHSDMWNRNFLSGNLFADSSQGYDPTQARGKLNAALDSALPNSNEVGNHRGIWGQIFASNIKQGAVKDQAEYDTTISGLIFGGDKTFTGDNKKYTIGSAFTYAKADSDNISSNKISSYQLALYNRNSNKDELGFYNDNIINIGYNRYDSSRNLQVGSFNANAGANYNAMQYGAKTAIGYNYLLKNSQAKNKTILTPYISLRYSRIGESKYTEEGAGDVGLNVKNKAVDNITSGVGGRIAHKTAYRQIDFIPSLNVEWLHNLKDGNQQISSSFIAGGPGYNTSSPALPKDIINVGTEIIFPGKNSTATAIRYDLQKGSNYTSNTASLRYRMAF